MGNTPEVTKIWRDKNREHLSQYNRDANLRRRMACLNYYESGGSPHCACCGEKEIKFLAIDHINDDGYITRKKEKEAKWNLCVWLIKNQFSGWISDIVS